ncbi:hypothetical protein P886_0245 [Alteromonadaceae bacterium 2753L.S.0a.02]|nr:hypothetical protein P886_0245 [Alteromonadaceae bacterium 2753L.S.0a.02]
MDTQLIKEILSCLCGERTLFYYHRDQYAVYLLHRLASKHGPLNLRELRGTPWGNLLCRPAMQTLVANCGKGVVDNSVLNGLWLETPEAYVLTLDRWGHQQSYRWAQTSRPGGNLVLQLNLSYQWAREFESLTQCSANYLFGYGHPISQSRPVTLAWARLDIDFDTDEVLIEEIQSDLIREVRTMHRLAVLNRTRVQFQFRGKVLNAAQVLAFSEKFLAAFDKTWQEAMLTAAIQFCLDELGVAHLYYHSVETGNVMKNIRYSKPPRSLYSDLPKKFCFTKTNKAPIFLEKTKKVKRKLKILEDCCWYTMAA